MSENGKPPEAEKAGLWLFFACGHLSKMKNPARAHYWLENARHSLCRECLDKKLDEEATGARE